MQRMPLIQPIERLCFTTWNSYAQSLLRIYRTVACVLLDCLSLVEGNYYLKRAQHIGILPLFQYLLDFISVDKLNAQKVAFAGEFTAAGKLSSIKNYWSQLTSVSPKYGFFLKASKSYIIVKEDQFPNATTLFDNSNVNFTVEGKKHLRVFVGSKIYKCEYVDDLVKAWNSQLCILSTVAGSQPQAVYSTFASGFKNNFSCFMRTIPNISNLLIPIKDTKSKSIDSSNYRWTYMQWGRMVVTVFTN